MKYYGKSFESYEKLLKTDFREGLSEKEAKKRLNRYGMNIIYDSGRRSPSKVLFRLFYDPVSILLLVCALILFSYRSFSGATLVLFVWLVHNCLTIIMYYKSEQILNTVKCYGIPKVKVLRAGKVYMLDSRLLVPGDVLIIEAGDIICADCKLVQATDLYVYESDVTGREEQQKKYVSDDDDAIRLSEMNGMLFASSSVISGYGIAVVVATSDRTEIVSAAGLVHMSGRHHPELFYDIKKRCRYLGIITTVIALVVFIIKLLSSPVQIFDAFMIIVALIGSSMSEALLPLTQIVAARYIYSAAKRRDKSRVIIKNAGAIDSLRDLSVFVVTEEIVEHESMELLSQMQSRGVKTIVCASSKTAFGIATRFGGAICKDVRELEFAKNTLAVYITQNSEDRLLLISQLKKRGDCVGVLTTKLDCIRMLNESDVAFTYGKITFKTNEKTKINIDSVNVHQNQILTRISDVICEPNLPSMASAVECSRSIFATISDAASYLVTTQLCRCLFACLTVITDLSFTRFGDILVCGMLIDLSVVLTLAYINRKCDTNRKNFLDYRSTVLAFIILFASIMLSIYLPQSLSFIDLSKKFYADVCFSSFVLFAGYTLLHSAAINNLNNNKLPATITCVMIVAFISALAFAEGIAIFFGVSITPVSFLLSVFGILIYILSTFIIEQLINRSNKTRRLS